MILADRILPNPSTCIPQNLSINTMIAVDIICINDTTDGSGKYSININIVRIK